MRLVFVGGHLSPALSITEALKNDEVFYVGRKHSLEGDKALSLEYYEVSKRDIPFFSITTGRFQRKFTRYTVVSLSKLPVGFVQAYKILNKLKPDAVIAFGGYLSLPVAISAKFLNIPVVIHEQTLGAGFANKLISPFAKKILISWESSRRFFPKEKTVLTGNPLRKEILDANKIKKESRDLPLIYITGGSTGSHMLNLLVEKNLERLLKHFYINHQTGDSQKYKDYDRLFIKKEKLDKGIKHRYNLKKFFDANGSAESMINADIIIGRAGINTITELIYLRKPALLIPLLFGQKNEQIKNANFLKKLGLAEVLDQNLITDKAFMQRISFMLKNLEKYKLKKGVLIEGSSEKIVKVLRDVSKQKTT